MENKASTLMQIDCLVNNYNTTDLTSDAAWQSNCPSHLQHWTPASAHETPGCRALSEKICLQVE